MSELGEDTGYSQERDDALWIVTSSFIIFTMQSGFGLLESGSVSSKNEVNIMVKNIVDVVCGGLAFWTVGYGAMVERTKLVSYMIYSTLVVIIHCFPAHWLWSKNGFLKTLGAVDVAGAGAIHIVGGTIGMVSTVFLKPRIGRFGKNPRREMSSPTNVLLGTFMLWWGWLGFNCGSTWGITEGRWHMAARSAVSTILSSVGGGAAAIILSYACTKKCQITFLINGILGSLVSITGICAFARPWYSILIGAIGSCLAQLTGPVIERLQIDDPVGVIPVHLVGGVWGMLATGFFLEGKLTPVRQGNYTDDGLLFGGGPRLLGVQAISVVTIIAWSAFWALAFLSMLKFSPLGLRVSEEEESLGADHVEHDLTGHNLKDYDVSLEHTMAFGGARKVVGLWMKRRKTEAALKALDTWKQKALGKRIGSGFVSRSATRVGALEEEPRSPSPITHDGLYARYSSHS